MEVDVVVGFFCGDADDVVNIDWLGLNIGFCVVLLVCFFFCMCESNERII